MTTNVRFAFIAASMLAITAFAAEPVKVNDGDRIAFLGDSITQYGNGPVGYVNLVMKGLEVAGVTNAVKIPAGISGHKSDNMRGRLQRDVLDKHPQWMTLSCGVNDVWHGARGVPLDAYKANISNILDRCAEAGVKVVVLTATMIGEDPNNGNNRKLAAYNGFLREEAAARGLPLADLNADMQALLKTYPPEVKGNKLTADGVHMAWDGNRMMARGVLRAFGVPEERFPDIEKAWRQIRGFREYRIPVSADEAKAIEERAKVDGRNAVESVRDFLLGK
jgi:lysophospholipase L1-like esterase